MQEFFQFFSSQKTQSDNDLETNIFNLGHFDNNS